MVRDWLTLAAPDYVTYRVAVATAQTNQGTALATAEQLQNNQEAAADVTYATQSSNAYKIQADSTVAANEAYRHGKVLRQNTHTMDYALAMQTRVGSVMLAVKMHAVNTVTGLPNTDATLATALNTAWNNSTGTYNTADNTYWTTEVQARNARLTTLAGVDHAYAYSMATSQENLRTGYAAAEMAGEGLEATATFNFTVAMPTPNRPLKRRSTATAPRS